MSDNQCLPHFYPSSIVGSSFLQNPEPDGSIHCSYVKKRLISDEIEDEMELQYIVKTANGKDVMIYGQILDHLKKQCQDDYSKIENGDKF